MTYKVVDSGVSMSSGRGKAKVVVTVDFSTLDKWARRMKQDEKKLWRQSYGRACSGLKKKFQKVVSRAGGAEGVPQFKDFEDFTKLLRARAAEKSGRAARPMGGVLAGPRVIVAFMRGGWQYIGWPDRLAKWAVNFQDGIGGAAAEKYYTDPKYRHFMHVRAATDYVPPAYVHNPRRVLPEPFGAYVRKNLDEWARHIYYKDLAKLMKKNAEAAKK